jgi:hypothetical protein
VALLRVNCLRRGIARIRRSLLNFLQATTLIHFAHSVAPVVRARVKKWRLIRIELAALLLGVLDASRLGRRVRQVSVLVRVFLLVVLVTLHEHAARAVLGAPAVFQVDYLVVVGRIN